MTGIVLQATATGIGHRDSYTRYFKRNSVRYEQLMPACETVKFVCPVSKCGAKNETAITSSIDIVDDEIIFQCRKCGRNIQVSRPPDEHSIIVPGTERPYTGIVGADGRPINK